MGDIVATRATSAKIKAVMAQLVQAFAGHAQDPWGVVQGLQLRLGVALLSKVQQAFVVKSHGGTGEDGIKWKPLKRSTIVQRRIGKGDLEAIGRKGTSTKGLTRGLLTPDQDRQWRIIFMQNVNRLMFKFGLDKKEAFGKAAAIAWAEMKRRGAKTKLEVLGGRKVDILRDTGQLWRSLSPGIQRINPEDVPLESTSPPPGHPDRIMEIPSGMVVVGTNNENARHHKTRPFWPEDGSLPQPWMEYLVRVLSRGVRVALQYALART